MFATLVILTGLDLGERYGVTAALVGTADVDRSTLRIPLRYSQLSIGELDDVVRRWRAFDTTPVDRFSDPDWIDVPIEVRSTAAAGETVGQRVE